MSNNNFALCIQTSIQATILQKFGHQEILCIDYTHVTNSYDFTLVTIAFVDYFGDGYPVVWCLSNRDDQFVLEHFLSKSRREQYLKHQCGSCRMTLTMQFYNAWRSVFGLVPNKLLCTWHVDRARMENLTDNDTQVLVYHNLQMLMEELDVHKFETR